MDKHVLEECQCTCGKFKCASRRGFGNTPEARYENYKRTQAASEAVATKRNEEWTADEVAFLRSTALNNREAATALGRTYSSVKRKRYKLLSGEQPW